jgi:hypothetical protein
MDIDMGDNQVGGLAEPTHSADAATKAYVDGATGFNTEDTQVLYTASGDISGSNAFTLTTGGGDGPVLTVNDLSFTGSTLAGTATDTDVMLSADGTGSVVVDALSMLIVLNESESTTVGTGAIVSGGGLGVVGRTTTFGLAVTGGVDIDVGGSVITTLGAPTAATDAANKAYVDSAVSAADVGSSADTELVFNNSGTLDGNALLTFNNSTSTLSVGTLAVTAGASLDVGGSVITTLGTPTAATDAATKAYVDSAISAADVGSSADTEVVFNNAGTLDGHTGFTFDNSSNLLKVSKLLMLSGAITTTDTDDNLVLTANGAGNVVIGASSVLEVQKTTDASSTASGALVVSGGVGIAKALHVGTGGITASSDTSTLGRVTFKDNNVSTTSGNLRLDPVSGMVGVNGTPQAQLSVVAAAQNTSMFEIRAVGTGSAVHSLMYTQRSVTTNGTPALTFSYTTTEDYVYMVEAHVVARRTDGTSGSAVFEMSATVIHEASGVPTLKGGLLRVLSRSNSAYSAELSTTSTALGITVTGAAATTLTWHVFTTLRFLST